MSNVSLLVLEHLALDDLVDEAAQSAILGLQTSHDGFHGRTIGKLHARAGSVGEQVLY